MELILDGELNQSFTNTIFQPGFEERLAFDESKNGPFPSKLKKTLILAYHLDLEGRYLESHRLLKECFVLGDELIERLIRVFGGQPRQINNNSNNNNYNRGSSSPNQADETMDSCCQGVCLGLLLQAICGGGCN